MEENQKPFICSVEGCMLRFTLEDHLTAHKRKHDMVLNLENGQKTNIFMADQTPTPTRFIRNCEEVGLFQDLQNVNPFEETFRKAVEATREGGSHMEVTSLHTTTTDDTLHTPHVFPNIVEEHQTLSNLISSTQGESRSQDKSPTRIGREELEPLEVSHILNPNAPPVEVNNETRTDLETIQMANLRSSELEVIKQEADTLQKAPPPASSSHSDGKIPVANVSVNDSGQVVIRMPDGQLVQLSGVSVGSIPSTQLPIQITSSLVSCASVTQPAVISTVQFTQNPHQGTQGSSSSAETSSQARLSAAKMKLKQRIQCNSKQRALTTEPGISSAVFCKVPLLRSHRAPSSDGSDSSVSPGKKLANGQDDVDERRMRFRERNRAAAMRCREKRKHWILELEKRADETQKTNQLLSAEVTKLRNELMQLKTLLLAHKNCSVTKAIQQGAKIVVGGFHWSDVQLQLKAAHSTPQDFEDIEGNACSSPEEQSHKVVLLTKPTGLKRRRLAAAALTVCGSAETNSKTDKHPHSVSESPIIATDPNAKISRTQLETHKVMVDKANSSKSCVIAVATPSIVPRVPIHPGSSLKKPPVSSTSYFAPPKVHQLSSETPSRVIKVNSNVLKSDGIDNSSTSIVNHANGDSSMDSGHGSDIEILVEIPTKHESRS